MLKLSLSAFAILFAACGGGGGAESAVPQASAPAIASVIQYGDSTVAAGCAPGTADGHCPASVANADLQGVAVVRQEGVGGTGAWHLQTGRDALHLAAFDGKVAADVVSFRFGINDSQLYSADNFREIMRALVGIAQAAGKKVILETPTPVWDRPELAGLGERAQVLRDLAAATGATLCDHNVLAFQQGDEREVADGVHRTPAGITLDGKRLAVCVRQAIGR